MSKERQLSFEFDTEGLEVISVYTNTDQEKLIKELVTLYLKYIEIKRLERQKRGNNNE